MAAPADPTQGQFITKAFWDTEIYNRWNAVDAAWTDWTPDWTSVSGSPSLGNGTLMAAYKRHDPTSKTVHFRFRLVAGSTTVYGTGAWSFSLPIPPATWQTAGGWLVDTSTTSRYAVSCYLTPAGGIERVGYQTTVGISNGNPFTWADGDFLFINGTYETS